MNSRKRTKKQNKVAEQKTTATQKPVITKAKEKKTNRAEMVVVKYNKMNKTATSKITKVNTTKTNCGNKASTGVMTSTSVKDGLLSTTTKGGVVGKRSKASKGKDNTPTITKNKTKSRRRTKQTEDYLIDQQQNQLPANVEVESLVIQPSPKTKNSSKKTTKVAQIKETIPAVSKKATTPVKSGKKDIPKQTLIKIVGRKKVNTPKTNDSKNTVTLNEAATPTVSDSGRKVRSKKKENPSPSKSMPNKEIALIAELPKATPSPQQRPRKRGPKPKRIGTPSEPVVVPEVPEKTKASPVVKTDLTSPSSSLEKRDKAYVRVFQRLLVNSPTACPLCTWSFQTYDELKSHLLSHKLTLTNKDGGDTILKVSCLLCQKVT